MQPSGLVTLLFTDIEGSTRAWELHPVEMQGALTRHDALLRDTIEATGGFVFKTVGDAFCAAFADSRSAVNAAAEAQRRLARESWPDETSIRVRMALHTGVCAERDGDYFGPTVNRVARLEAIAHGGQVVLSERAAAAGEPFPAGVRLLDLGQHRLKDLTDPEHVFQLTIDGLASEFPPLRSLGNPELRNNLPRYASSFVGRTSEVLELQSLVREGRLVTLVGAGGCGKTRLAVQVAAELLDGSGDGVWLVELASLTDGALVAPTVAAALDLRLESSENPSDAIARFLKSRHLLLVIDNCEHVVEAVAELAGRVLSNCPGIGLLATSREPLRVRGEQVFRVASLETPPDGSSLETVLATDAVQLFVERARARHHAFDADEADGATLGAICRQLDGIPLAIELAAARVPALTLRDISDRLGERFRLLTSGDRDVLPRHQTLRAMMDWSYELLADRERLALCRLSTFAGGFTIDAAEAVVGHDERIDRHDVVDLLSSLSEKSLLVNNPQAVGSRYAMLETVRQFAALHLASDGETEEVACRGAHSDLYLMLAERAEPELSGPDQVRWFDVLDTEHDNLRAALAFTTGRVESTEQAYRFARALGGFWDRTATIEGVDWLTVVLQRHEPSVAPELRAAVLANAATLRIALGQMRDSIPLLDEALSLIDEGDHHELACLILSLQGFGAFSIGDLAAARDRYQRGLALAREHVDRRAEMSAIKGLADVAGEVGDHDEARANYQAALSCARMVGDHRTVAAICCNQAILESICGDLDEAERLADEGLALAREIRYPDLAAAISANLGILAVARLATAADSDARAALIDVAIRRLVEALEEAQSSSNEQRQTHALYGAASAAYHTGDPGRAVALYGRADAISDQLGLGWEANMRHTRATQLASLRNTLGVDFEDAYRAGRTLPLTDAIRLVREIER